MQNHEIVFNRSHMLFWVAVVLFLIASGNIWFMINELNKMKIDSELINNTGMIRGSLQRVAKLELGGMSSAAVIADVDLIFKDIHRQAENHKLIVGEMPFSKKLLEIEERWNHEKRLVAEFHSNPTSTRKTALLEYSEVSWGVANQVVNLAQDMAEQQIHFVRLILFILGLNVAISIFIVWNIRTYMQKKLEFLASHDALTKILNRYSFNTILTNEVTRSRRYKAPLSLIIFDIDYFKIVNDTYGHKTGDYVLRGIAKAAAARVRGNDMVFRIGGEEFAVLAVESDISNAANLAERLRKVIEMTDFKEVGKVTASFGVAQHRPEESEESFFRRTDIVLYQAKREGRNRVVVDNAHTADLAANI